MKTVQTVQMKCSNAECEETWRTGNVELEPEHHQLHDPICDKCGQSGYIEHRLID